jgi:hypothetical protein
MFEYHLNSADYNPTSDPLYTFAFKGDTTGVVLQVQSYTKKYSDKKFLVEKF